jgi:hypothetical protein
MNPFENAVKKIGHAIAWPFVHAEQVIKVLETALTDEPAVKTAVTGLITQIEALTADGAVAVAAKGIDVSDDVATVAAAQTLFKYVTETFLPAIEEAFKDVKADLAAPAAAAAVSNTPGLASVTAE